MTFVVCRTTPSPLSHTCLGEGRDLNIYRGSSPPYLPAEQGTVKEVLGHVLWGGSVPPPLPADPVRPCAWETLGQKGDTDLDETLKFWELRASN